MIDLVGPTPFQVVGALLLATAWQLVSLIGGSGTDTDEGPGGQASTPNTPKRERDVDPQATVCYVCGKQVRPVRRERDCLRCPYCCNEIEVEDDETHSKGNLPEKSVSAWISPGRNAWD